ncbi:MAG: ribonuclease D [Proteobacteria bacterium]|nr:ribonuclease D [Pseudomonadota bacterium]
MTPELIESSEQMDTLLQQLKHEKLIAVDTEFFRETTYYPKLALVQIATDSIVACIDPLAFDAKPALCDLLLDTEITKIFHSCSQDMEVLFYYLGQTPASIYDTQIANALLSDHHQIGYAALVENELGVQLDKSQTRTNWLQRPLTAKQVQYAGDDVLYLYQLYFELNEKLQQLGRIAWFEEDSLLFNCSDNDFQVATDKLWKRVKGAARLNQQKLAIVQAVAVWREQLAQQKDKTRRRILGDDIIVNLAFNPPKDLSELKMLTKSSHNLNAGDNQQLFTVIESALQLSADEWPDNRFSVLDDHQKTLLKTLQQMILKKVEALDIAGAVLCSRKDLEKLIVYCDRQDKDEDAMLPPLNICRGWRYECIGKQLIAAIESQK